MQNAFDPDESQLMSTIVCPKSGSGVVICIEKALANSGVAKENVNYVNAYATSTPTGDLTEYQALIHCFGKNPEVLCKHLF